MSAIKYHQVSSQGASIFYHERGGGEPLVLIMGFGADGTLWEKHAAVYEKHFRCIIPDNRGVGKSTQPQGPYSTRMMADDVIAVMDLAGVRAAKVVGISMGGAIAQELAISYPERTLALVLVSTWAKFNAYATAVYENLKQVRATTQPGSFTALLQLWIFAPPYFEKHHAELKADAEAAESVVTPQTRTGFEGQLDACIDHDALDRLQHIQCPVLITVGRMDIFTPPDFSYAIKERISQSILSEYAQGGHVHHWEDLERFNSETLNFLLKN